MNGFPIGFGNNLSIGILDIETMKMVRIEGVDKTHELFKFILTPFDCYSHGQIKIFPDPTHVA